MFINDDDDSDNEYDDDGDVVKVYFNDNQYIITPIDMSYTGDEDDQDKDYCCSRLKHLLIFSYASSSTLYPRQ